MKYFDMLILDIYFLKKKKKNPLKYSTYNELMSERHTCSLARSGLF